MKQKGFTLIELLVVVAIIGILAAVGTVAYNGYTSAAKKNTTKANHDLIIKYMQAETFKCEIDPSSKIMQLNGTNLINCSDLIYPNGSVPKVSNAMKTFFDTKIKNAFDSNLSAINSGTSINGCYESGRWKGNYGGQGAHHIAVGWVDINQNSNWKMNFFIESCIESSRSPIKSQIVLTE